MQRYEYKVIPAPTQGKRGKGAKGLDGRFANAMSLAINEAAAEGWEYLRSDSLPSVDRTGFTRKKIEAFRNVLVFRRAVDADSIVSATPEPTPVPVVPVMEPLASERTEPQLTSEPDVPVVEGDDDPDLREVEDEGEETPEAPEAENEDAPEEEAAKAPKKKTRKKS